MTEPIEDRVKTFKTDSPEQRLRTAELRAELGAIESPEMTDEQIAVEWGTLAELVEEVRSRAGWDDHRARIAEYNAERRKVYAKERAAAYKRFADAFKKPSLPARVIGALWRRRGRND